MKRLKKYLTPVVFLLLIALTIRMIIRENKSFSLVDFAAFIRDADPAWMIAALVCAASYIVCEGAALLVICDCLGYRPPFRRGIVYSAADIYFSAVTPSASGGQPASALFMVRDGMPSIVTTAALLVNLAMYTISIVLLTLGLGLLRPDAFEAFELPSKVLIVVGAAFQGALFAGLLLLIYRDDLLMRILRFFERLPRRLKLARRSDERLARLEKMKRDYNACARTFRAHRPKLALALLLNLVQRLSNMLIPAFVYLASGGRAGLVPRVLATQSMVVVGSNAVPIPGAVGVADMLFLDGYASLTEDCVNLELLSRSVSFYMSVLICAAVTLAAFVLQKKHRRIER